MLAATPPMEWMVATCTTAPESTHRTMITREAPPMEERVDQALP